MNGNNQSKPPSGKHVGDHVICITSDKMGTGPDELGDVLMRAFINIIDETAPLPRAIAFYNTGIRLTLNDSPVLESLRELTGYGVRIIICGTCVNFFEAKDKVAVGTVSNMYDIAQTLTTASHVIRP
jgi:selenium metabolism protein YedF